MTFLFGLIVLLGVGLCGALAWNLIRLLLMVPFALIVAWLKLKDEDVPPPLLDSIAAGVLAAFVFGLQLFRPS